MSASPSPYPSDPLSGVANAGGVSTIKDVAPLSTACARALNDKMYDKRKAAAMEIEKMTREFVSVDNKAQIKKLLKVLGVDFAASQNPNMRKGGLIGLSAAGIGLSTESHLYIEELLRPIMTCLTDTDSRVRYYACESLYNILKVSKHLIVPIFNDIFCAMGMVVTDLDQNVRTAAELLDRLLKNVATESKDFDLRGFVTVLKERLYSRDPFARQFHLGWISDLEQVPDSRVVDFLPEILDQLFIILGDPNADIHVNCRNVLGRFLCHVQDHDESELDYALMINILITHAQSDVGRMQVMALDWIKVFLAKADLELLPFVSGILLAGLPLLSLDDEQRKVLTDNEAKCLKEAARQINVQLMRLAKKAESDPINKSELPDANKTEPLGLNSLDVEAILKVLVKQIEGHKISAKLAALRWTYHLFSITPKKMKNHVDLVFPLLLQALSDSSEEVVINALQVLSTICNDGEDKTQFRTCIMYLMRLFKENKQLFEAKGPFIVRQLCLLMKAEEIYEQLAKELLEESNLTFARQFVDILNSILLSTRELFDIRRKLISMETKASLDFFLTLYHTWCHSPVPAIALCLLSGFYSHACDLVRKMAQDEVTVDILIEIDKLIQHLESPVFAAVRMHLLDVGQNDELFQAFYGLLMILPQSSTFKLLQNRLQCVPLHLKPTAARKPSAKSFKAEIDCQMLMTYFDEIQSRHQKERRTAAKVETLAKGVSLLEFE
ncbi:hypothetical protein TCAL_10641 [Tigriopus californicus]|uniref:Protein VAC14 homolog n=1 Tax=Tigriopus californicus TaxID=6832 RepID=A0A553N697_TIGCA|nr:protein VAC14 homolog [Tigriopus californicus]TRY60954.1 hypothetical protein TCAL_10641 [Tigriopus californicus]